MGAKAKSEFAKSFGKHLKEIRLARGISLKHFEAVDGAINRHELSRIENGRKIPNLFTVLRIARRLGVDLRELFRDFKY
ncbi:MAG: helix-turn-helix transcriptional regulator [Cyclobacteriaceae bacterium]|nr:helix-turn-helix transcriptional regulator [Cyclobacteriaceae bacterium]